MLSCRCWALWNLAAGSEANRELIFRERGVECVVNVLARHIDAVQVCEKALGVLDNLGVDGSYWLRGLAMPCHVAHACVLPQRSRPRRFAPLACTTSSPPCAHTGSCQGAAVRVSKQCKRMPLACYGASPSPVVSVRLRRC